MRPIRRTSGSGLGQGLDGFFSALFPSSARGISRQSQRAQPLTLFDVIGVDWHPSTATQERLPCHRMRTVPPVRRVAIPTAKVGCCWLNAFLSVVMTRTSRAPVRGFAGEAPDVLLHHVEIHLPDA